MSHDTDPEMARALQLMPTPDHRLGFWEDLESQLLRPDYVRSNEPPSRHRRQLPWAVFSVAALVLAAIVVLLGSRLGNDDDPGPVATQPPTSTSVSRPGPVTAPPTAEEARAIDAVKRFVAALGAGDVQQAASLIGVRSEDSLVANYGSVETYLSNQRDDLRAWGRLLDRHVQAITVRPGDVVVVFEGAVPTVAEAMPAAFAIPARQAVSADAWFVEPWAFDSKTGGRIELMTPDPAPPVPQMPAGTPVEVSIPAPGQVWIGFDDDPLSQVTPESTSNGLVARWTPTNPLAGPHVLIVVYQNESQTTFTAIARMVEAT